MTTDTAIDPRVCEIFDLALSRTCDLLQVSPAEAAAVLLQLSADALDRAPTLAPPNHVSFKHRPVQIEPQPEQQMFVPLRF